MRVTFRAVALALIIDTTAASAQQLGHVHFATSCAPATAEPFDRAVAWLHSFEFGASIRGFQEVLSADSTCAMAWWGIALSRWSNPMASVQRPAALLAAGRTAAAAAARLAAAPTVTERERGYVAAVNALYADYEHSSQSARTAAYEQAMAALTRAQPADTEAMIFHAIALVAIAPPSDKTYANQLAAGAVLERIFAVHLDHPGLAHYIIHAYDVPALAQRAELAAARYAGIAPSAAHALHMPSHTFTRVGMWQESVDANQRSFDVSVRDSSYGEALHASDYMLYAYLQMRNDSAARAIVARAAWLASRYDPRIIRGAAPPAAAYYAVTAIPARFALEHHAWSEAARLPAPTTPIGYANAITWFARALGAAHEKELALARSSIDSLVAIRARLAASGDGYWAEQLAIQELGARAWLVRAQGAPDSAVALMRDAANREDATEKAAVTPGPLAPARELLGDMLMELHRPAEALVEYRACVAKEPNRYWSQEGVRLAEAALAR